MCYSLCPGPLTPGFHAGPSARTFRQPISVGPMIPAGPAVSGEIGTTETTAPGYATSLFGH